MVLSIFTCAQDIKSKDSVWMIHLTKMQNIVSGISRKNNQIVSCSCDTELQMFRGRGKLRPGTQKRIEGKTCIVGLSYTEKAIEVKKLDEFIDRENVGISFLKKWIKGGMPLGDIRETSAMDAIGRQLLNFANVHILLYFLAVFFFTHKLINLVTWTYHTYLIIFYYTQP